MLLALLARPARRSSSLTWLPWLHHFDWDWAKWWDTQAQTYRFHFEGGIERVEDDPDTGAMTPTHPYYARPWAGS